MPVIDPTASSSSGGCREFSRARFPCGVAKRHDISGYPIGFQAAEVTVSRQMFADNLSPIGRLRAPPAPA